MTTQQTAAKATAGSQNSLTKPFSLTTPTTSTGTATTVSTSGSTASSSSLLIMSSSTLPIEEEGGSTVHQQDITVDISDQFDGGNGMYVEQLMNRNSTIPSVAVKVRIKPDPYTELEQMNHMQYFAFQSVVSIDASNKSHTNAVQVQYILDNASTVSYPEAWAGTTVFVSSTLDDPDGWTRKLDTVYTNGVLTWTHTHEDFSEEGKSTVYFSYFPPYTYAQHQTFIEKCRAAAETQPNTSVMVLGQSLDGRDIECISCGTGPNKCWIIHRQHPGETMAEYYAEGLLTRLLGLKEQKNKEEPLEDDKTEDSQVAKMFELYTFYIVPCMCPDGGVRGHLRTNACGANLNREWATIEGKNYEAPTLERSPEVFAVLQKMDETGVDMFLDVHGDEELPYNFGSGAEQVPTWGDRLQALHGAFLASYSRATQDMQQKIGYPPAESPEDAVKYLNVATNQIATRFDCLSMTLEMPFKDCQSNPDPERGWSPERSRRLGASVLKALEYMAPHLRSEESWKDFPDVDRYIAPTDQYQQPSEGMFQPLKKRMYSDVRPLK